MASSADLAQALAGLGRQVKQLRMERGLSLNSTAREIGCSASTLTRLETAGEYQQGVSVSTALRVLRWLAGEEEYSS